MAKESAKASPRRSAEDPYQRQQFTVQQYRETLQQTQQTYSLERRYWL
ncbi:MAG: hypothetical protein HC925_05410 [Coleofasciculaceae cyanobacterium SM2_3_26]|nr:hypothetical protein [Coleofasciculaceae cyanobacterium SM2_3_26]